MAIFITNGSYLLSLVKKLNVRQRPILNREGFVALKKKRKSEFFLKYRLSRLIVGKSETAALWVFKQ